MTLTLSRHERLTEGLPLKEYNKNSSEFENSVAGSYTFWLSEMFETTEWTLAEICSC
jgi:hypothetical protein